MIELTAKEYGHYCCSDCPDTEWFEPHEYQLKEMQRKILLAKKKV